MRPTRGGERLRGWLEDERRSQAWLADQIGSLQQNVSAWIRGRQIPLDAALAIEKLTGIGVSAWAEPGSLPSHPPRPEKAA